MSAATAKTRDAMLAPAHASALPSRRDLLRALVVTGCAASALAGYQLAARDVAAPGIDADLVTLLQGMAIIKALLVLPMAGLLLWRFGSPVKWPLAFAYLASLWVVTGATAMIWQLSHIAVAALLFHTALFAFLVLALRDENILLPRWKRFA